MRKPINEELAAAHKVNTDMAVELAQLRGENRALKKVIRDDASFMEIQGHRIASLEEEVCRLRGVIPNSFTTGWREPVDRGESILVLLKRAVAQLGG